MTQQKQGVAIESEDKDIANRITQYRCDYRVSQRDMPLDIAMAIAINTLNLFSEVSGSTVNIMQTLSWLGKDNRGAIHLFFSYL